jgi:hypothetical protein
MIKAPATCVKTGKSAHLTGIFISAARLSGIVRSDEFEPYWRGSWSHNTVVIDGLSQHRKLGPSEPIPDPDRRFVMGKDFAVGWYLGAFWSSAP